MKKFRFLTFLLIILTCSGCLRYVPSREEIGSEQQNPGEGIVRSEEEFFKNEKTQRDRLSALIVERSNSNGAGRETSYKIGIGDQIQIDVFEVPELTRTVRVRPNGQISLPLVNTVSVVGKTESELQAELTKLLDRFLQAPQVSVFIAEYASQRVSVIGAVAKPGAYSLKRDDFTLLEILSEAGGRTDKAGGYIILIPGSASQSAQTSEARASLSTVIAPEVQQFGIEIPFDELMGSSAQTPVNITLRSGDTVVVPEAGFVQVDGEVTTPGSFTLGSRMTLLGAIAAAKSLTYSADVKNVEVIREIAPGTKAILAFDLEKIALGGGKDVRLRDGDVVRVPSAGGRFVTRQVVEAISSIFNVGSSVR